MITDTLEQHRQQSQSSRSRPLYIDSDLETWSGRHEMEKAWLKQTSEQFVKSTLHHGEIDRR